VRFAATPMGRVELSLMYQPCTEQECLAAITQRLEAAAPST
jgi:hypothetical protein